MTPYFARRLTILNHEIIFKVKFNKYLKNIIIFNLEINFMHKNPHSTNCNQLVHAGSKYHVLKLSYILNAN